MKSFKIEGRLKGPEYVAITTRAYRLAVDAAWQALHTPQAVGDAANKHSNSVTGKGDLEGLRALKKKIACTSSSTSTSATSSDRFNGVDDALMRDLKQVFARGQDQDYDGLSAGTTRPYTHTHTHIHTHTHTVPFTHSHTHTHAHTLHELIFHYFTRTPGFLGGVQHQALVRGRSPRHRGLFVGTYPYLLHSMYTSP